MFVFVWSEEFERYELTYNKEIYYGLIYNLPQETIEALTAPLTDWRAGQIRKEEEEKDKDIINTTLFSVILNCSEYDIDKRIRNFDDNNYHHIATYHKEDSIVPPYTNPMPVAPPIAYPVFIPSNSSQNPAKPPRRRGDINADN